MKFSHDTNDDTLHFQIPTGIFGDVEVKMSKKLDDKIVVDINSNIFSRDFTIDRKEITDLCLNLVNWLSP